MCIALPMKVTAVNGTTVHCERTGRAETADASMVEGLIPGDFVLVFRNEVSPSDRSGPCMRGSCDDRKSR